MFNNSAVAHLTTDIISSIRALGVDLSSRKLTIATGEALVNEMHRRGINLQFLYWVRNECYSDSHLSQLLTTECFARYIRRYFRAEMKRTLQSGQEKQVALRVLNAVMGTDTDADKFWDIEIHKFVTVRRNCSRYNNDRRFDHPNLERQRQMMVHLVLRAAKLCGIRLSTATITRLCTEPLRDPPFVAEDILGVEPQVKGINFDEAMVKLIKEIAESTRVSGEAFRATPFVCVCV